MVSVPNTEDLKISAKLVFKRSTEGETRSSLDDANDTEGDLSSDPDYISHCSVL